METVIRVQSTSPDAERSLVTSTAVPRRHTDNAGLRGRSALSSCSTEGLPAATHYNLGTVQGLPNGGELLRGSLLDSATPSAEIQRRACGVEERSDDGWMQRIGSTIWNQRSIDSDPKFARFLARSFACVIMPAADCIRSPNIRAAPGTSPGFTHIASAAI